MRQFLTNLSRVFFQCYKESDSLTVGKEMMWNWVYIWHREVRRGRGYCLLICESSEEQITHQQRFSILCAHGPLWVISHFIKCCQESMHAFVSHRWRKATHRGRYRLAWRGSGCCLTEGESQSRCGGGLNAVYCSGVCSRHQHGVSDCCGGTTSVGTVNQSDQGFSVFQIPINSCSHKSNEKSRCNLAVWLEGTETEKRKSPFWVKTGYFERT